MYRFGSLKESVLETFCNLLAALFVVHFCWSYYTQCWRRGYTMDLWHFSLLYNLFVIHVQLPFSRSDLNIFMLGPRLRQTQEHITQAYLISAFGYACMLAGGQLWRMHGGLGLRRLLAASVEWISRGSMLMLRSRFLLIVNGVLALLLTSGVLAYYFRREGFGFNLRGLLLIDPALRPVAQFAAFYSTLVGSYCLARYYQLRERSMLTMFLLVSAGLFFFGERAVIAGMVITVLQGLFIILGRRLRPALLLALFAGAMVFTVLGDALRQPDFSVVNAATGSAITIFYGNSFSDTRDFATVLSGWDGHFYYGLTYLAGVFAFIPRVVWSFRDTFAIGVVTARTVGFSPTEHPGLRVGIFGEAYLNFGLAGVALIALFIGAVIRLVDERMKQSVRLLGPKTLVVFSYIIVLSLMGVAENSSTASAVYTTLFVFAFAWVTLQAARALRLAV